MTPQLDDDIVDWANDVTDGPSAVDFALALHILGWKIVPQREPDHPGQDIRWPMMLPQSECPLWTEGLGKARRPTLKVVDGGKKG
jgi:hypothetical protein